MSDWIATTINALVKSTDGDIKTGPFGTKLKASQYSSDGNGVPLISVREIGYGRIGLHSRTPRIPSSVQEELPEFLLRKGDIVIGRKGAVDRSAYVTADQEGWFLGSDGIRIRILRNDCDPRFIAYQLQSEALRNWILRNATGTTMPSLNQRVVGRIPINLPPLAEQTAIARILGALDDKIELNREMNRTLEATAQAIFRSWFVDFDPVVAKADGRKPFSMRDEIAALFPDRFVDSEMGPIPEGWKVIPFSELIEIQGGGTPNTSIDEFWNGEIPWFSVVDTPEDGDVFVVNTERTITEAGLDGSSARLLEQGTTIITARGTVGNLAVAAQPMAINQSCYGLTGRSGRGVASTYFGCQQLVSDLQQLAHGSVFDTITRATFSSARVVDCSPKVIAAFERTAAPLLERIKASVCESQTLAALRDLLLPKLLSGEIRVAEAERELEEAGV